MNRTTEIKNVIICGLGAIGTIYADKISTYAPQMLHILADKKRCERYKKEPVTFNGNVCKFNFIEPTIEGFKADLIIIATKNSGFEDALVDIQNFVGENTIIMSLLNGISSEEQLIEKYGEDRVLYSYFVGHTSSRNGRNITFDGQGEIVFGEKENFVLSEKTTAVKDLFEKTKIPYSIPEDMQYSMWKKFLVNIGTNQASAVLGGAYKLFQNSQRAMNIAINLMKEGQEIAKAKGIKNADNMLDESIAIINSMLPETKSSMLQDVEAGRKTEVEIFAGKIIELGKTHNIMTPYNSMFFELISTLDEKSLLK